MFVVTSRHLSEITFLLRPRSVPRFVIRTVTFCCSFISCLFRFNYSHPSWLMKDTNRSLAPTARSRFRMHRTSCQSGLQWKFMNWLQVISKTGGHCLYNINVIYWFNSTLAINYFYCASPLSKAHFRFANALCCTFLLRVTWWSTDSSFFPQFSTIKNSVFSLSFIFKLLSTFSHFKTSFVIKWGRIWP